MTALPVGTGLSRNPDAGGTIVTFRRAFRIAPEFARGFGVTLLLAVLSTAGRVVVPVAVQQTLDHGLGSTTTGSGTKVDLGAIRASLGLAVIAVIVTATAAYFLNVRLFTSTESGLATLRIKTFRHVHDLSMLRQASQSRGALVSRVTSDVDQLSNFLQWGGIQLLVSVLQLVLATALMIYYSWPLTLLVYVCFTPLALLARAMSVRLAAAYGLVRERVGVVLSAVSEAVVGAAVVKAFGVGERTGRRIDQAIGLASRRGRAGAAAGRADLLRRRDRRRAGQRRRRDHGRLAGRRRPPVGGPAGRVPLPGDALRRAGAGGDRDAERRPERPRGSAPGARRARHPGRHRRPGLHRRRARDLPPGPIDIRIRDVAYAYPGGPEVLRDVDLAIPARARIAVVGETGSGKTTLAKLITRLVDPLRGSIELAGVPLEEVAFTSLRRRVVMVPQEGHLFESTIAENVRYGRPGASDAEIARVFDELGLADWLAGLPGGLAAPVGQRGESLSAGERQLVAVARAHLAGPDLLVLDEATSAIDPATEMRLSAALESLAAGRTTVTIAHRLKAAELADEVIVVDAGRIVQRGTHAELVSAPGVYARLHASWAARGAEKEQH